MADSILKLRVESQEYDQKIKRAAEGIQQYAQKCREAGGTLEHLDDGVLEFVQALGQMDTVATSSRQQLREMSNALTTLTMTYRGLTEEEKSSPFGQELAKGIQQLTERAGQAQDAMADVQASIRNASSDTRVFDQLSQGASVMTAGFQGLTGAAKMLGIEMGDNVEVIARLQAAMAVTNSLTTIQTALQKQSALMQGIQAVQATAAATAQALYARNTALATAAGAAFNAVAKANPYVLLASAVAAVGVALVGFSKNAKKATEATETQTNAMKQAQRMADIWKNTMGSTYSSLMTKYDELKRQWQSLASEHSKTEWIKKNQTALQNLGGAVNDVKSAEDFFNNNTDAVVQSFVRRAQAAARVAQLTELYRKQIELLDKKSQASADIAADAQRSGRSAKAGDEITDKSFRSSRYGSVNAQGKWVFSDAGAKLYSGTDTSNSSSVMKIDLELQANQAEIDKVKDSITNEFKDVTISGGGGGGGNGGTSTVDKEAEQTARMLAELRKQEAKATKEIADARAREHQTETKGLSGFNEQTVNAWTAMMKDQLSKADFGSVVYNSIEENMRDMTTITDLTKEALKRGLDPQSLGLTELFETAFDNIDVPDTALQSIVDKINAAFKDNPIKIDFSTGNVKKQSKEMSKDWKAAASAIQDVGSAMSQIEDPAAKVVGTVAQAIATIALSYAQALKMAAETSGPWAWIAFAGTGLGTMLSSIAAIHSATGYAEGGMIKGNSYSGDNLMAKGPDGQLIGLNAGEIVLNRAQQGAIAGALQGGGGQTVHVVGKLSGESLFLCAENWAKRTGRGEFVTWR